jgi:sulfur-carrier protein adenylyltransferase/sulfurtransferase
MNPRIAFSITLFSLGLILTFLPRPDEHRFKVKPNALWTEVFNDSTFFTVDQIAHSIADEDSSILLIDLRSPGEFLQVNIPGSINIPYKQLLSKEKHLETYLSNSKTRVIFYSNGDMDAGSALVIARGLGYSNAFVMKGGLNEWFLTVMNTRFKGERITVRENALFESRTRAKNYFIKMNSLPDSLKLQFAQKSKFDPKKLDGGCE